MTVTPISSLAKIAKSDSCPEITITFHYSYFILFPEESRESKLIQSVTTNKMLFQQFSI